ncbi:hypothetical protein KXW58_006152 [Aspergillus fumigatus]|nr:hypothetical protein KXW58_006152 [Aspergillus fumigatus]
MKPTLAAFLVLAIGVLDCVATEPAEPSQTLAQSPTDADPWKWCQTSITCYKDSDCTGKDCGDWGYHCGTFWYPHSCWTARGKEDAAADAGDDLVDDDLGPAEVGVGADVQACGEGHKRVPVQMDGLLSAPAGEGEAGEDGSPPGIVGALHHFIASET